MTMDQMNNSAPANSLKKKKKHKGIESLKSTYGRLFVLHWEIGLALFFVMPLLQSFYYAFCDVSFSGGEYHFEYAGLKHFDYAWNGSADFSKNVRSSLTSMAGSLPVIVIISLILALLLNQKFRGRLFFRGLYFLPVIIATGVVIDLLFKTTTSDISSAGVSDSFASDMLKVEDIIEYVE